MKKKIIIENGVVIGTASNKYEMKNPIAQYLLRKFDASIKELIFNLPLRTISEVGCGEGHVTKVLLSSTQAKIKSMDISDAILNIAKNEMKPETQVSFVNKSIYNLSVAQDQADLVVCCEVLEHLEKPQLGLEKLAAIASPYVLLSVPREPIFRCMNFLRGAYFKNFGNSPGHIQHWSKKAFIRFVEERFDIVELRTPLPWVMVLARIKNY